MALDIDILLHSKSKLIIVSICNSMSYYPGPDPDMTKKANGLCKDFFRDFHGVMNPDLVTNVEINNGNQGSVSFREISKLCLFF